MNFLPVSFEAFLVPVVKYLGLRLRHDKCKKNNFFSRVISKHQAFRT